MEQKQNKWVTVNILARRKLKRETEKAVLFSIPKHKGLSVWISKKCIHGSRNGKMFAVGIKADDEYMIWIYDADSNRHLKSEIWQGQILINLYQAEFKKIVAWLNKQQATKNIGGEQLWMTIKPALLQNEQVKFVLRFRMLLVVLVKLKLQLL